MLECSKKYSNTTFCFSIIDKLISNRYWISDKRLQGSMKRIKQLSPQATMLEVLMLAACKSILLKQSVIRAILLKQFFSVCGGKFRYPTCAHA